MTSVALRNRDSILEQIAKGRRLSDIAADLGLRTHSAIINALGSDPEYLAAREIGAEAKMDTREKELEGAAESVTVARARELLSHARWRAEREFPARWGQKTEAKVDATLTVNVVRLLPEGRLIEEKP